MRNAYKNFCRKTLRDDARLRGDNIRMDRREIGGVSVDWNHPAHDTDRWWAFVNVLMNVPVS
jgi:hypothetical protein